LDQFVLCRHNLVMAQTGRRRGVQRLAAGAATILIVAAGAIFCERVLSDSNAREDAAVTAAEVHAQVEELSLVLHYATEAEPVPADVLAAIESHQAAITKGLEQLGQSNVERTAYRALAADADAYFAGLGAEVAAMRQGDSALATQLGAEVVDPAFTRLDTAVERAVTTAQAGADAGTRRARVGVLAMIPLVGLAVSLLLWREAKRQRAAERRRHQDESQARLEAMVQHSTDLIALTDEAGVVVYASPAARAVLGRSPEDLVGTCLLDLTHTGDRATVDTAMAEILRRPGGTETFDQRVRHADGGWRSLESVCTNRTTDPRLAGVVWNCRDVTDRRTLEDELSHLALHDSLTGLANRTLCLDRLGQALARTARRTNPTAVLLLDLDDFKDVNDSLGHQAGDAVLIEVAERLERVVRPGDTVGRLGGDEFAVVLEEVAEASVAREVAHRVLRSLAVPISTGPLLAGGRDVRLGGSIGLALSAYGQEAPEELVRNADVAMYRAKDRGKGCTVVFEPAMHSLAAERLDLSMDLEGAAERDELVIHFQPTVSLDTGHVEGAEALVRWQHPTRGLVSPAAFIPLAEQTGAIVGIGRWVLRQACAQAAEWHAAFPTRLRSMSVNLSGRQLAESGLVADVRAILHDTGLPPSALVLEITESVLMRDTEAVIERLRALKELGLRLAVDDFGTGYSSLAYLGRFAVDILKIDKSFVDAATSASGSALVQAIVAMASSLDLETVAEGIEDNAQVEQMAAAGCGAGQGFLMARPMPAPALAQVLTEGRPLLHRVPQAAVPEATVPQAAVAATDS
jgi:diguanylate cyclase (GGDEF)-like protein/PAS domain S-box-containing protein